MNKLVKSILISTSFLFSVDVFSQELTLEEKKNIEARCKENNKRDLAALKSYGVKTVSAKKLLSQCIKNSTEITLFDKTNTTNSTEELYDETILKINNKLGELVHDDSEQAINEYNCYLNQLNTIEFAKMVDSAFLRRTLIAVNMIIKNKCVTR